jgi:hypothetical protein
VFGNGLLLPLLHPPHASEYRYVDVQGNHKFIFITLVKSTLQQQPTFNMDFVKKPKPIQEK